MEFGVDGDLFRVLQACERMAQRVGILNESNGVLFTHWKQLMGRLHQDHPLRQYPWFADATHCVADAGSPW